MEPAFRRGWHSHPVVGHTRHTRFGMPERVVPTKDKLTMTCDHCGQTGLLFGQADAGGICADCLSNALRSHSCSETPPPETGTPAGTTLVAATTGGRGSVGSGAGTAGSPSA